MKNKQLIQQLVNALSHSSRYVHKATKESFRADVVMDELCEALDAAREIGIQAEPLKEDEIAS
mgnify:CR=1 FL=1